MRNLLRAIVLLLLLSISGTAAADVFYDTYQRALAAFKAKDYAGARADFLRAYDLRPEPIILFNVAQTYRLELGLEQAIVYYRRFLAESKIAEDLRNEAQAHVASLEAQLKAGDAQKELEAKVGPREPDGAPVKMATPPMGRLESRSLAMRPSDTSDELDEVATRGASATWSVRRKISVGMAAGGVLALTTGTMLGISARSKRRDAYVLCSDPQIACDAADRANELIRSAQHRAIAADVAFGVGAAAVIAAGVLWFTGVPQSYRRIVIAPAASPEQVAITASGRF
jgi:tetratricopeptide (TPR) repeat protein